MAHLCFENVFGIIYGLLAICAFVSASEQPLQLGGHKVPSPPYFVAYSDKGSSVGPPDASEVKGYNVFALSFLLTKGAADKAQEWATLDPSARSAIKSQYAAAGISLIVSLFGSTDTPTSAGADPITTAQTMAAWVKQYDLDGVDVDYEDFDAVSQGKAAGWLGSFTTELRKELPKGSYILTHAPVAPWFSPNGPYLAVHSNVGDLIDWYNVQFYNQGPNAYTTCDSLLTKSSDGSALFEIAASGVPLSKLVIGKPATESDANNGFMSTDTLATCLKQASGKGWNAGVMVWEFSSAKAAWIQSARSSAFPLVKRRIEAWIERTGKRWVDEVRKGGLTPRWISN